MPQRKLVTIRVPGEAPTVFERLDQDGLSEILRLEGARGFALDGGTVSRSLEDLASGSTVDLVLPRVLPFQEQVHNLQRASDSYEHAKERELEAFLRSRASAEAPGAPVTTLQPVPFTDMDGQEYVKLDAGVVAGDTAYLGEYKRVLGEAGLDDLERKLEKTRRAVRRNRSPDLAAALQGVMHVKLFLGGEAVRPGLAVPELAKQAAEVGASLVLLSGQAMALASEPAPAVPL